jgi:lysophospholipase L1-like esterase
MTIERRPPGSRHPILFRAIAVGLGIALSLVLFEAALRLNGLRHPAATAGGMPAHRAKPERRSQVTGETESTPWFNRYDGRAVNQRAQMVPFADVNCDNQAGGSEPVCEMARHNSSGFRMPEFTIAHPPDTFRIVIVGDSFTWGDGTEVEDTYHQQLQLRYDGARTASGPRVEIIALGVSGSSFTDNITRLLTYGDRLQPDLVLVQFCNNDLQQRATLDLLSSDADSGYADFLLDTTAAGRLLRDRIGRVQRADLWNAELARMYDPGSQEWKMFTSALATLDRWRSLGVPVAFVSFVEVDSTREGRNFKRFQDPPDTFALRERAEKEIERQGFPLLRLAETFRARAGDRFLAASTTNAHYGPYANELAADAIVEFLRDADWTDLATPRPRRLDKRWTAERALRDVAAERWADYRQSADLQRELFSRLLKLYPDDPWLIQDLARVYRATGNEALCRATYLQLAKVAPGFSALGYHLSGCSSDSKEQAALLTEMLETVPDHPDAIDRLAGLDAEAGRLPRACGCYSRLSEIATYTNQVKAAIDARRRYHCEQVVEQSCPGPDPFGERARSPEDR